MASTVEELTLNTFTPEARHACEGLWEETRTDTTASRKDVYLFITEVRLFIRKTFCKGKSEKVVPLVPPVARPKRGGPHRVSALNIRVQ